MRLQHWISTSAALGFFLCAPHVVLAESASTSGQPAPGGVDQLPKDCVDAGLKTKAECDDFLRKAATKSQKPATAPAAVTAAPAAGGAAAGNDAPVTNGASVAKPNDLPLPQDCVAAGVKTKKECDAFLANGAAKPGKAKTPGAGAISNNAAAGAPAAIGSQDPKGPLLAKDCIDAGVKTQTACDALHAADAQKTKGTLPANAGQVVTPNTAASTIGPANPAGVTKALVGIPLAKDCIDAGLKTQADCDALHAANLQKGKSKPPAGAGQASAPPNPIAPATSKSGETQVGQPGATAPTLPNIADSLDSAAKSYNGAALALSKAGQDKVAADKARADLKNAQSKLDELCKSNQFGTTAECLAKYRIQLAQIPTVPGGEATAAKPSTQPVEVITTLPKGVTQDQVAPLLDSAKEVKLGKGQVSPAAPQGNAAATTVSNTPPPTNDKTAQAAIKVAKVVPVDQLKGQQIDPKGGGQQVQVPQNVTIINQTVSNNTTNTTIGVQNNGAAGDRGANDANRLNNPIGLSFDLVLQLGNQLIINSPARDQYRIADGGRDHTDYERLPQDQYREIVTRPDGVRIITVYDRNGDILRRSRFDHDGHETVIAYFDDSRDQDLLQWRDPGDELPPLRLSIPAQDYVLDAGGADERRVEQFFSQPPVEQVQRLYSISEVKRSARVRDMVRRLEIGDLTFDTGAATVSPDQFGALTNVAEAMLQLLQHNPAETFLIEGHTDAVGSDISNLQLSDARAATVAGILTDTFRVPPENLATQGYGAHFLKVETDGPERLNRRVTIRRITPLVTFATNNQ